MSRRITIVIPTRERCDTLHWAIKTCVTQDYDDLEILISDNASRDATKEVIDAYDDSRIRYINPGRRLSMSEHWEFALSHLRPGHFGVIGDDDGLLPRAIEELAPLLDDERPLIWPIQQYFWPSYSDPDLANSVVLPLRQTATLTEVNSQSAVRRVLQNSALYPRLPSPYFGIIPTSAVNRIREESGRVFHSSNPDIYAGFAVAAVCDTYLYCGQSYSLAGQSKHSNGASQLSGRGKGDVNSPATKYDDENTIPFHRDLVSAPSIPLAVAESALQANDHLDLKSRVDIRETMRAMLRDPLYLFNPAVQPAIDSALEQIAEMRGEHEFLAREFRQRDKWRLPRMLRAASASVLFQNPLLECDPRQVTTVFDAAAFVAAVRPRYQGSVIGVVRRLATRPRKLLRGVRAARRRLRSPR